MTKKEVRDLCGLYCVAEFADYERAQFFMYLIGTGVSRSRYELTAQDRKTHAHLFDIQVEASAQALEVRALKANTNTDVQAVSAAFKVARQIIDSNAFEQGKRFHLQLGASTESLRQIPAD